MRTHGARTSMQTCLLVIQEAVEDRLVQLAQARLGMAALVGDASYSHHRLRSGSLAGTPEAVAAYLRAARRKHADPAAEECAELERFARDCGWLAPGQRLSVWDRASVQSEVLARRLKDKGLGRGWGGGSGVHVAVPLHVALQTLFGVVHDMLGVRFETRQHSKTCAPFSETNAALLAPQDPCDCFEFGRSEQGRRSQCVQAGVGDRAAEARGVQ